MKVRYLTKLKLGITYKIMLAMMYFPGGGNGRPLQYSCLRNSIGRRLGVIIVQGVAKSQT